MQNTTKKQAKRTLSRKTKKNNTALKVVLIFTALCCLFSTIAQASEQTVDANNINRFGIFKYETLDDTGLTYTGGLNGIIENNGKTYNTNLRTTYTTRIIRFWVTINPIKINNAVLEFDVYSLFDNGEKIIPTVTPNETYNVGSNGSINGYSWYFRTKNGNESTYTSVSFPSSMTIESYGFQNYTQGNQLGQYDFTLYRTNSNLHYKTIINNIYYETDTIVISLPVTYISSTLVLDNINIKINDEVYQIVNELENTIEQIKQGQENAINAINTNGIEGVMNDLQDNLDNTLTEIVKYNNDTLNAVFYTNVLSGSAVMQIVMMISMTITIISYIIFGKYK